MSKAVVEHVPSGELVYLDSVTLVWTGNVPLLISILNSRVKELLLEDYGPHQGSPGAYLLRNVLSNFSTLKLVKWFPAESEKETKDLPRIY